MAFDISGIQNILGTIYIGYIPPMLIALLMIIITAILINGIRGDKTKTIITMAPTAALLASLGFSIHPLLIILLIMAFGVLTILGSDFREHTIETD